MDGVEPSANSRTFTWEACQQADFGSVTVNYQPQDSEMSWRQLRESVRSHGLLQVHLLQVAMTAGPFMTDHLFLSAATMVKQLGLLFFQVVQ